MSPYLHMASCGHLAGWRRVPHPGTPANGHLDARNLRVTKDAGPKQEQEQGKMAEAATAVPMKVGSQEAGKKNNRAADWSTAKNQCQA